MKPSGLLKDAYVDDEVVENESPVARALRLKRKHMLDKMKAKADIVTDKPMEERLAPKEG